MSNALAATPEQQLEVFLAEYEPAMVALTRQAHARLRALIPGAIEMVYDNYNALVIGFGAGDRPSEAVLSLAVFPRKLNLVFIWGKGLPDPEGLLRGDGNQVRNIHVKDVSVLERPAVLDLIRGAVERSTTPFDPSVPNRLVIRSVSPTRRPRRPS